MKKDRFIIAVFLVIIFGVLVLYPVKYLLIKTDKISFNSSDNWKTYEKSGNLIKDKVMALETAIDNRTTNYFPLYEKITSGFYNFNIKLDSLFSSKVYIKSNSDGENLFYDNQNNFYFLLNNLSSEQLNNRLKNQISFYNDINTKYSDINLYIYLPLRYEVTNLSDIHNLNNYVVTFKNSLNKNIKVSSLDSLDLSQYLTYFYKTDHHYNSVGALKAYNDIVTMMDINNVKTIPIKCIYTPYYGSLAKTALNKNVSDNLLDLDYLNDVEFNQNDDKFKTRKIVKKTNPFYDYYISYYNGQYDEIKYKSDVKNDKNLLIISDSLSWQIDYIIAENFENTYVINLRYGKWKNQKLYLQEYLSEHNITDILFLQEAEHQMFDLYNHNISDRVVR